MDFIVDKQTLNDLNLLGKFSPNSIYSLFNKVQTAGGEKLLEQMFKHPLTDPADINDRSELFRFFSRQLLTFPFENVIVRQAEDYLQAPGPWSLAAAWGMATKAKTMAAILGDEQYKTLLEGISSTVAVLGQLKVFLDKLGAEGYGPFSRQGAQLRQILAHKELKISAMEPGENMAISRVARLDFVFRRLLKAEIAVVLETIYELDLYMSVGKVACERKFSFAFALPATANMLQAEALRHPALAQGVANPVSLHQEKNVLFLTGANMAGKSTYMKSVGIAVYLAHMGFPVAATGMRFSVRDGLYTSINVSDNLNMGYSHFYAEVLRVKEAAGLVSAGHNMVVIFDELFKGTNVKDAFDATAAVTTAFSRYRNCVFIISTHIIEVGEQLRAFANVRFGYMPTIMEGHVPIYTYLMREGITNDRHGMMIVQNEGILDLIAGRSMLK